MWAHIIAGMFTDFREFSLAHTGRTSIGRRSRDRIQFLKITSNGAVRT
jgi:hypothetical protein